MGFESCWARICALRGFHFYKSPSRRRRWCLMGLLCLNSCRCATQYSPTLTLFLGSVSEFDATESVNR